MSSGGVPTIRVKDRRDLHLDAVETIAFEGASLILDEELLRHVDGERAAMLATLAESEAVYGVTTGTGYHSKLRVENDEDAQSAHMLLGRAVGSAPYLSRGEARALIACKLVSLLSGRSGAAAELCSFAASRLNDDFCPAIPRTAAGCAGEVIALSHCFQTFLGVGQVIEPDGSLMAADAALEARGVAPYRPVSKEGIALLAGADGTTALALGALRDARRVAPQLLAAAAAAAVALRAPHDPYDPAVAELAGDPLLSDILARLRALLGEAPQGERSSPQAPISFRIVPQMQAHLERGISRFEADVRRALGAVSDSPAFIDGGFVSTGAFHEIELASGLDALAIAYAQLAEVATQRIHRLLDPRFSELPSQLAREPGRNAGLIVVHKRALGAVNELRRLATPAALGISETSLAQEDAMTFSFEAAEKLRRSVALAREVAACELVCARQAMWLGELEPSEPLRDQIGPVFDIVAPCAEDRPLGPEIGAVVAWLEAGQADRSAALRSA